MKSNTALKILNAVALVVTIVMNALSNALPFNNRTTSEISDSFASLITPAGYVFSIWGLIYVGLIAFVIYSFISRQATNDVSAIGGWFLLSCVANSLWLLCFHYGYYALSLLVIVTLLISLIVIYARLRNPRRTHAEPGPAGTWFVRVPFSIYLGWLSVATAVNVSVLLLWWNWDALGLPPTLWAVLVIGVTCALSLFMSYRFGDIAYTGVIVWALIGIAVKQANNPAIIAACAVVSVIALIGLALLRHHRAQPQLARQF